MGEYVYEKKIRWEKNLPIGFEVYSVKTMPSRIHEDVLELIICLEGECDFSFSMEQHKFQKGDFIAIDEDAFSLSNGKDCICASIYLDINYFIDRYPLINYIFYACEGTEKNKYVSKYNKLKGLILSMLHYLSFSDSWDKAVLLKYASAVMDIMVREFNTPSYMVGYTISEETLDRLTATNKYIIDGIAAGKVLSQPEIASQLGLTTGYFSEFIRLHGISFREAISYFRAAKAERYLMEGNYTMMDISEECGFSDTKYFYKAFRHWHNMGPREFRDKFREMSQMKESVRGLDIHDENVGRLIDEEIYTHYLVYFAPE